MMGSMETTPKVLLFPFLAHGHLSPFFELAKKLSNLNFVVYFCSTKVNLKAFSKKLFDYSIKPVEFHMQSSSDLPPHYHTTNGLPPHLFESLIDALENSDTAFSNILESVQPDLVICDIFHTWIPPLVASHDIPLVCYQLTGAVTFTYYLHSLKYPDLEFPFHATRHVKSVIEDKGRHEKEVLGFVEQSNEIILIRSSRVLEEKYIDFESILADKKIVSLGSLLSEPEEDLNDDDDVEIIQWLNGKEEGSTVYIAFGSETFLIKEEVEEIALGLEMSNVNFIWVVRSPKGDKTRLEEIMPKGFLDRIKGKGYVENVWAPQTKILKHPSTGAFVSHSGWGSILESISFGVPVIAMPMHNDQPFNAKLVEELGVGLEVVGEENGKRKGEELARTIEEVMFKDEGKLMRGKAKELGRKVRDKSKEEFDVGVQELREICEKRKKNHMS